MLYFCISLKQTTLKKIIFFLSLVLFSSAAIAQSKDRKAIKKVVSKVIELNEAGKYKESLDYTYPALFDLVPREMLEAELDKLFGADGEVTIKMENLNMLKLLIMLLFLMAFC